jgi:hypothetical protein
VRRDPDRDGEPVEAAERAAELTDRDADGLLLVGGEHECVGSTAARLLSERGGLDGRGGRIVLLAIRVGP